MQEQHFRVIRARRSAFAHQDVIKRLLFGTLTAKLGGTRLFRPEDVIAGLEELLWLWWWFGEGWPVGWLAVMMNVLIALECSAWDAKEFPWHFASPLWDCVLNVNLSSHSSGQMLNTNVKATEKTIVACQFQISLLFIKTLYLTTGTRFGNNVQKHWTI